MSMPLHKELTKENAASEFYCTFTWYLRVDFHVVKSRSESVSTWSLTSLGLDLFCLGRSISKAHPQVHYPAIAPRRLSSSSCSSKKDGSHESLLISYWSISKRFRRKKSCEHFFACHLSESFGFSFCRQSII
jgi:hypothetical protein